MANLVDVKTEYGTFSNDEKWLKVTYDFDNDTGAIADYVVFTAKNDLVITDFYAVVQTAVTSGGANVNDLGVGAGGTEIWSDKAVANLIVDSVHGMDTFAPIRVATDGTVQFGIEAATTLTGKIQFNFKLQKIA